MGPLRWLTRYLFRGRAAAANDGRDNTGSHEAVIQPSLDCVDGSTHDVVLYTRRGCHLCDDAQRLLEQHGLQPRLIDIDGDPELVARYTNCVPVVLIDGHERFRGRVNPVLLRRLLSHRG